MKVSRRLLATVQAKGWRFHSQGRIDRVLRLDDFALPFDPSSDNVLLKMIAAPITRADIQAIQGSWAYNPASFPAVAGNEGVGEVVDAGAAAEAVFAARGHTLQPGDRVIPLAPFAGTWANYCSVPAGCLAVVPKDIPVEHASLLGVAPLTAYNLLQNANLQKGDWVAQNGANGTVGGCLIGIARSMGYNTLNVVRQRAGADDVVERVVMTGGTLCVTDDYLRRRAMAQLLTDDNGHSIRPKLVLNSVGGRGATELARLLATGGIFRTFGGAARKAVEVPVSAVVFNRVTCDGFFLPRWLEETSESAPHLPQQLISTFADAVRSRDLVMWSHRFAFQDFADAVAYAFTPAVGRKAIIRFDGSPSTWEALPDLTFSDVSHQAISQVSQDFRPRTFDPNRTATNKEIGVAEGPGGPY
eukprot:TRINITY_DN68089_c0_g1_i1.p1 TRINITY_DN68089_c0_g1~~TRINITY_DN68089_c0_g1_i1.p1  ORF type:complete len:415 (-),score=78.23 TRINITY_DN68089_c0_g1_i1:474-1718(-)